MFTNMNRARFSSIYLTMIIPVPYNSISSYCYMIFDYNFFIRNYTNT